MLSLAVVAEVIHGLVRRWLSLTCPYTDANNGFAHAVVYAVWFIVSYTSVWTVEATKGQGLEHDWTFSL